MMGENPYPARTPGWWAWVRLHNRNVVPCFAPEVDGDKVLKEIIDTTLKASGIDANERTRKGLLVR